MGEDFSKGVGPQVSALISPDGLVGAGLVTELGDHTLYQGQKRWCWARTQVDAEPLGVRWALQMAVQSVSDSFVTILAFQGGNRMLCTSSRGPGCEIGMQKLFIRNIKEKKPTINDSYRKEDALKEMDENSGWAKRFLTEKVIAFQAKPWKYDVLHKFQYAGSAWDELKHIRQAVGFMVIHQKYRISYDEITNDLCPILSVQQLYRICTLYWDDKYNTRSVSPEVISSMRVLMTEESSNAASSSFLLDDNSSIPFSIDELSNSIDVKPATDLFKNPAFGFLHS
ncbi:myosin XI [Striga asiatica]|uniref:Myosin XI n=1 Tax=Striga asiatica TaxID=4170 RepID=A0A5A7QLV9_STRAF|nr:myosin XI [Striga asiatica]